VAAVIDRDADGTCKGASIVLGAAAPVPHRATEAEKMLLGQKVDEERVMAAAKAALAAATPLAQNGYKVPLFHAIITRTVLAAAGGAA